MPALNEVAKAYTDLDRDDLDWLHLLIADWQVIADLSFADLVLWLPDRDGHGYWGGAQVRPTTGPTAFVDDLVGAFVPRGRRALLDAAFDEGRIAREGDPEWRDDVPVRVEAIPVLRDGSVARRGRPQHQPAGSPDAQPAGAVLHADGQRPDPDDQRRPVPASGRAARLVGLAAGR